MASHQIEDLIRAMIAMQSDPAPAGVDMERQLGPVVVGLTCGNDRRVGDVALRDSPEGVSHEPTTALQLGLVVNVLELTAAAIVPYVVGTAGLNPVRRGLQQPLKPGAGKAFVLLKPG
jgi:hypothetical protein